MAINCFAASGPGAALKPFSYEPGPIGPDQAEIAVTHCSICHSDIHLLDNDWGVTAYPFVPGHEVVGKVKAVGSNVGHLKVGQRVGVGWQCGSCHHCEWCDKGFEPSCAHSVSTCVSHHGGFGEAIRVDASFALPIPEKIESKYAAPLFCAGITVYSPLSQFAIPSARVGIVGIGGLGHLGIQFANSMGSEVTAFSTSATKRNEALELGAQHFILSSDEQQMKKVYGSYDVIVSVATANVEWPTWLRLLRPHGTLVVLGASPGNISVPTMELISGQKRIVGSAVGGRAKIGEMLEFASRQSISPIIETMPMELVNEAIKKVRENKARYRIVLEC